MFPVSVFIEREEFAREVINLPPNYKNDNAAALLRIIWELQKSLMLELQVTQGVKRLDLSDARIVRDYANSFEDYVQRRTFDLERTSCHMITELYKKQVRAFPIGSAAEQQQVSQLEAHLQGFDNADVRFTEEIEPIMDRALEAMKEISSLVDSGDLQSAKRKQADFALEYDQELARLKTTISLLNRVGTDLIAAL